MKKLPLLKVENLFHAYDGKVILDINELRIFQGEIFTILGSTGAGKSTLLRVIGFLEKPLRSRIEWQGKEVSRLRERLFLRRQIAMVFQEPLLFNTTVFNNVAYGLNIRGVSREEIQRKVEATLKLFSIEHLSNQHARKISGGEAQRVSLARALVIQPQLLLLDEPLSSLDPSTKDTLKDELRHILKKFKITTVYVTHDQTEAFEMADRIAILEKGKILQVGTPMEIFYRPNHSRVASFVGVENILHGRIIKSVEGLAAVKIEDQKEVNENQRVNVSEATKCIQAVTPLKVGTRVVVCLRAEEITLLKSQKLATEHQEKDTLSYPLESARNYYWGKIKKITMIGSIARVNLDCGFPLTASITRRSLFDLELREGEKVKVSFKATAVHVIPNTYH